MKQVFTNFLCIATTCFTIGCSDAIRDWVAAGSGNPPNATVPSITPMEPLPITSTWDFTDSNNYSYDSNYIEVTNSTARLRQVDQTHSGTEFNGGDYNGTYLDSNGNMSLKQSFDGIDTHVNTILPGRSTSLIGYWKFDEDWNDSTSLNHNGVPTGDINYASRGKLGSGAANCDGSGDYLAIQNYSELSTNNITVSTWVKLSQIGVNKTIVSTEPPVASSNLGFGFRQRSLNNIIWFSISREGFGYTAVGTRSLIADQWFHLVGTYDGSTVKLFVNGALDAQTSISSILINSNQSLLICSLPSIKEFFNGRVDDVSLWNEALSDIEVATLFNSQNAHFTELSPQWTPQWNSLVGYWKMDGNWQDSSGNGHHGTAGGESSFVNNSKVGSHTGSFDGTNDNVNIPDHADFDFGSSDFSVMFWTKRKANCIGWDNYPSIGKWNTGASPSTNEWSISFCNSVGNGNGIRLTIEDSTNAYFSADTGYNYELNQWLHIVALRRGSNIEIYINGQREALLDIGSQIINEAGRNLLFASASSIYAHADLDDIAILKSALTAPEINLIYHRQKQKFSGHYDSPIINVGSTVPWTNLTPKTRLPFYKELVSSMDTELTSDYSLLSGNLSNGVIGYWPLNEISSNTAPNLGSGNTDYEDRSTNNNHADEIGGVTFNSSGILNKATSFDGVDDHLVVSDIPSYTFTANEMSASIWFKGFPQNNKVLFSQYDSGIGQRSWAINSGDGGDPDKIRFIVSDDGSFTSVKDYQSQITVLDGSFHNATLTFDNGVCKIYIDGIEETSYLADSNTPISTIFDSTAALTIGSRLSSGTINAPFYGILDEAIVWNRALSSTEVNQLYRRSANRIKYQVKSCVDSSCNCTSYNVGPNGSESDCDGDGILNPLDLTDSFKSQWLGRDGSTEASFSELQNCLTIDSITTGQCTGTINSMGPSFNFVEYPNLAQPTNNQYFQYRVIMEAEENIACSSGTTPCMPELTSVTVGPAGRYFAGAPVITALNPIAYSKISSLEFSDSGCPMTYQLSPDGTNYRYWNGSVWAMASGANLSESTLSNLVTSNISSFVDQVGPGNLYWRAFMASDSSQACQLNRVTFSFFE